MIYTTTPDIHGHKIHQTLGMVRGSHVRAKWFGADIIAGLRNIFGGEIKEYTKLLEETRMRAINSMTQDAQSKGANAIVSIRFATSQIGAQAAEILVYGTAVVVK